MAFDPLKSSHYKLVYIRRVRKTDNYCIDMYSSETDSWSPLEITFTLPNGMNVYYAVFCNGAVHWYSLDETSFYVDVDRQSLNIMPMPDLAQRVVRYFGESWGHLHLIVTESPYPLQFDVLEMAPDYSGWFLRYHVNLDSVRIAFPNLLWYYGGRSKFSVLHVIRAQKEEESIVVVLVDNKAIFYNVYNEISMKLLTCNDTSYYTWGDTFQYFESLTYF